eukprot:gene5120-5626_t
MLGGERYSLSWRKWVALIAVLTFAWDYYRDLTTFSSFALWALVLQFFYFQLPLHSRAIPYFHSITFIAAFIIPASYLFLLLWKPSLEQQHMEMWSLHWTDVLIRSFLVHFLPLIFHLLEVGFHNDELVRAYRPRAKQVMIVWPLLAVPVLSIICEFTFPTTEDTEDLPESYQEEFWRENKLVSLCALAVAYALLWKTVLYPAYYSHRNSKVSKP